MSLHRLSPDRLALLRELTADQDGSFVTVFFQDFLKNAQARIKSLSDAVDAQDFDKISSEAHALNSSCLNAGTEILSSIAEQLEHFGQKKGGVQDAQALKAELESEQAQVIAAIFALPEFRP